MQYLKILEWLKIAVMSKYAITMSGNALNVIPAIYALGETQNIPVRQVDKAMHKIRDGNRIFICLMTRQQISTKCNQLIKKAEFDC